MSQHTCWYGLVLSASLCLVSVDATTYTLGHDVVDRVTVDSASHISFLQRFMPFTVAGVLDRWQIYAKRAGTVYAQVHRPTPPGQDTVTTVVGETQIVATGAGLVTVSTNIQVQPGDLIGWYHFNNGVIAFGSGPGVRWRYALRCHPGVPGCNFLSSGGGRAYSIQARVQERPTCQDDTSFGIGAGQPMLRVDIDGTTAGQLSNIHPAFLGSTGHFIASPSPFAHGTDVDIYCCSQSDTCSVTVLVTRCPPCGGVGSGGNLHTTLTTTAGFASLGSCGAIWNPEGHPIAAYSKQVDPGSVTSFVTAGSTTGLAVFVRHGSQTQAPCPIPQGPFANAPPACTCNPEP